MRRSNAFSFVLQSGSIITYSIDSVDLKLTLIGMDIWIWSWLLHACSLCAWVGQFIAIPSATGHMSVTSAKDILNDASQRKCERRLTEWLFYSGWTRLTLIASCEVRYRRVAKKWLLYEFCCVARLKAEYQILTPNSVHLHATKIVSFGYATSKNNNKRSWTNVIVTWFVLSVLQVSYHWDSEKEFIRS